MLNIMLILLIVRCNNWDYNITYINENEFKVAKYKDKTCLLCEKVYIPNSPMQKYCDLCKDEGRKIKDRKRDVKRNRKNNNYKEHTRNCKICGAEFKTYYTSKLYCGSAECEQARKHKNGIKIEERRNKRYREQTKIRKELNRELKLKEISAYVEQFGYTLLDGSNYINSHSGYIELKCPHDHNWCVTYHGFKDNGARCLHCYTSNNYVSRPEQSVRDFFEQNYPNLNVVYNDRKQISPKELDLYFPDQKVAIEVCGLYWHSEQTGTDKAYHYNKTTACYEKGIRLITIFEDGLYNKYEVVMSIIKKALGLNNNKIEADECYAAEISVKEANAFFDSYHLQDKSTALKAWGLFYGDKLVSACSIAKLPRHSTTTKGTMELKRLCTIPNLTVVGGASKLFKRVIAYAKKEGYSVIKSYCDMRYANIFNPVYEKLGFTLNTFTKYTPHYTKNGKRYRNYSLRKTPEERLTGKTEAQLREEQGFSRIWDCGHRTYTYII